MSPEPVAAWIRVSSDAQDARSQLQILESWAERREWNIVKLYQVTASAWRGKHHPDLELMLKDASHGLFKKLIVVELSRLSREGIVDQLTTWHRLEAHGVQLASYNEPFIEAHTGDPATMELLIGFIGWFNRSYSEKLSRNTKRGIESRRASGGRHGRPKGSKDRRQRRPRSDRGTTRARRNVGGPDG